MRAHGILLEKPLAPHQEYMSKMEQLLPMARQIYREVQKNEAKENPDYDDTSFDLEIWMLANNHSTNTLSAPFKWNLAGTDQGTKPVNEYLHSAHTNDDGTITFNLYAPHMEDGLNYDVFVMVIMRTLEHEAVHMAQRDRMGADIYNTRSTGFTKASDDLGSRDIEKRKRGMRTYLSDPQEITAHAKDLHSEAAALDDPITVLKSASSNIRYLPTLQKYLSSGFESTDKVVKRLVSLAAQYAKTDNEQ
jgi:hypothetical protein